MFDSLIPISMEFMEGVILTTGWNAVPEESAAAENFAPKRKMEYLTGRHYARTALGRLLDAPGKGSGKGTGSTGMALQTIGPILSDANRAPIWPEGFVGCISHTRDYC